MTPILYSRLLELATKMHTWIFLHTGDEQEAYDEIGLTDEENAILGYSGPIKITEDGVDYIQPPTHKKEED